MNADYSIRDYQIAGPSPRPVYLPASHACERCGEECPLNEDDLCQACAERPDPADADAEPAPPSGPLPNLPLTGAQPGPIMLSPASEPGNEGR
jgi:hypothetical protein